MNALEHICPRLSRKRPATCGTSGWPNQLLILMEDRRLKKSGRRVLNLPLQKIVTFHDSNINKHLPQRDFNQLQQTLTKIHGDWLQSGCRRREKIKNENQPKCARTFALLFRVFAKGTRVACSAGAVTRHPFPQSGPTLPK